MCAFLSGWIILASLLNARILLSFCILRLYKFNIFKELLQVGLESVFRFSNDKVNHFIEKILSELPFLCTFIANKILKEPLALSLMSEIITVLLVSLDFFFLNSFFFDVSFKIMSSSNSSLLLGLLKKLSLNSFKLLVSLGFLLSVVIFSFISICILTLLTPFLNSAK